jgi:orotidine-5'-phosphate decarboxylase
MTLAITVLTSLDEKTLQGIGVNRPLAEQVQAIAELARKAGLTGVVASPQEAQSLREVLGPNAAIVAPGVRPAGASSDDQSRVATPIQALANGASYLVIGRPITANPYPVAAFDQIVKDLT